jgi:hypothetical protein
LRICIFELQLGEKAIVGAYDSRIGCGQEGVQVVWNRIIFPDASSIIVPDRFITAGFLWRPSAARKARGVLAYSAFQEFGVKISTSTKCKVASRLSPYLSPYSARAPLQGATRIDL